MSYFSRKGAMMKKKLYLVGLIFFLGFGGFGESPRAIAETDLMTDPAKAGPPLPPAPASGPLPGLFPRSAPPKALWVIERGELSNADWHLATVLQGMVNREQPRLYLVNAKSESKGDEVFLSYYLKEYGIRDQGRLTLDEALKKYSGLFKGYAVFSLAEDWTVNVADTYCALHDCLPVTEDQSVLAQAANLKKMEDFRGRWQNAESAVAWSLRELFPGCSKQVVASLSPRVHSCRDYFYAHKIFTFYLSARGKEYGPLRALLKKLPAKIPTMGYIARNGLEEWIVEYTLAESSKFMVPTDLVPNLSVHSGLPIQPLPEIKQWSEPPELKGKLGVVFALTDGDNLFLEFEHYLRPDFWRHPQRGELKLAWSMAPELYELAPGILRYYYQTRTPNDFFVALSGAGYTFLSAFRNQEYFAEISVAYMKLTGLDLLWSLDPLLYFTTEDKFIARVLGPLGAEGYLKGILAGYAPSLNLREWDRPPGYPPILYSRVNYFFSKPETLIAMIKADAAVIPKRGKIVFYGVNGWEVSYEDLLSIRSRLDRNKIILLSPQEAFAIIEKRDNK